MSMTSRPHRSVAQTTRRSLLAGLFGASVLFATATAGPALAATTYTPSDPMIPTDPITPTDPIKPQQTTQVVQNPASTRLLNPQPLPPKQLPTIRNFWR